MCFDPKLGHRTYSANFIPCDCISCTHSLDQHRVIGLPEHQQLQYQPIKYCTYWPVLGSFNNWNNLKLSYKETSGEEIDKIYQVVLARISNNMDALLPTSQYGAIHTTDTYTMGILCD